MRTRDLMEMSTAELVELHNSLGPERPATAKTFAAKAKLIERIKGLLAARSERTDTAAAVVAEATEPTAAATEDAAPTADAESSATAAEVTAPTEPKKPRGMGVGKMARELILAHPDKSYREISEMVRAAIPGSNTTEHSVRWYANDMRKKGVAGTSRAKAKKEKPSEAAVEAADTAGRLTLFCLGPREADVITWC